MAGVIIDRFARDVVMKERDRDTFEAAVKVAVSPLFLTWVMNFGGSIRITSPETVIDEYIDTARKAIQIYEKNDR